MATLKNMLEPGERVVLRSSDGNFIGWGIIDAQAAIDLAMGPTDVFEEFPSAMAIVSAYPNPFSSDVRFELAVDGTATETSLRVFDLLGREVANPLSGPVGPGSLTIDWSAGHLAPGIYVYVLTAGSSVHTGRLVHL